MQNSTENHNTVSLDPEIVRVHFKAFVDETGMRNAEIARAVGISSSALSQWVSDKYAGDNDKVTERIEAFIVAENSRRNKPNFDFNFVQVAGAKVYFRAAQLAHEERAIVVITARAGRGKTWAGSNYARLHPGVVFFEARVDEKPQSFFSRLSAQFNYSTDGTPPQLIENLIERLKGTGRLLIIDEAEQLNDKCLEHVRRLWDMTGVGILLAGMPKLYANMRGKKASQEQIHSRVLTQRDLPQPTVEDFAEILKATNPDHEKFAHDFYEGTEGSLRLFSNCYKVACNIAYDNQIPLNKGVITQAKETVII